MLHLAVLLIILPALTGSRADAFEVVCQIHLHLPIVPELADELRHCTVFIANSVTFDISKTTVLSNAELFRIGTLKRCNSSADVLLTIGLPFNATIVSAHRELCERIGIVLRDNSLDGVDLEYDVALLDRQGKTRYAQLLRRLRALLSDKYRISTTIGCTTSFGTSDAILRALKEHMDLVSVVGADMDAASLINGGDEFVPREYSFEPIRKLIQEGMHASKIVLSLLTVGIVFHPGSYRVSRSLQRSRVGVLSYGQVCELLQELEAKCGARKRPACSLFGGNGVVVYDSEKTAQIRTTEAREHGVAGVLILPNYDDMENMCDKGSFPLFRSLRVAIARQLPSRGADTSTCREGHRYADVEENELYYTCYNGRFQQNCCEPGSTFNELLQICININVPSIVLAEHNQPVRTTEALPPSKSPVTVPLDSTTSVFSATKMSRHGGISNDTFQYFEETFQNAVSYLDSIIQRALLLVSRLETLEKSNMKGTAQTDSSHATKYGTENDKNSVQEYDSETLSLPIIKEDVLASIDGIVYQESRSHENAFVDDSATSTEYPLIWPFV